MKKNNIVKVLSIISVLALSISISACNGDNESKEETDESVASLSEESTENEDAEPSGLVSEMKKEKKNPEEDTGPIPEIEDPTPDNYGETVNGVFIYNDVGYELFYGDEEMAEEYAHTISDIKTALGDKIKVYNLVVPTHVGVDLPDKFNDLCSSQDTYLNKIVNSYTADVIGVNAYNKIVHHRNEYLYFNSDHHWTALGAYYAYRAFANTAGIDPIDLKDLNEDKIEGYTGSLVSFSGVETLKEDYVSYYTTNQDIDCTLYDEYGQNPQDYLLIHSYVEGSNSYGVFLGGDQPLLVTKNSEGNGKKIAVIKESYGNALAPFFAYTYSEAHFIDFRYADINLKSYLEQNGIDEVIFFNNAMASATPANLDSLRSLVSNNSNYTEAEESYDDEDNADDNEEYDNENYDYDENDYYNDNDDDYYDDYYDGNDENYDEYE